MPARTRRRARAPRPSARARGSWISEHADERRSRAARRRPRRRARRRCAKSRPPSAGPDDRRRSGRRSSAAPSRSGSARTGRATGPSARAGRRARSPSATPLADREHEERPELRRRRASVTHEQEQRRRGRRAPIAAGEDEPPRERGRRAARPAARAASSGTNSQSPIRPRSNAEWWIAKTCQPTATATICDAEALDERARSRAGGSRGAAARPAAGRRKPAAPRAEYRPVGVAPAIASDARRGPCARSTASRLLVLGEDAVERAPRLGEDLARPRPAAPRCRGA